MRVPFEYQGLNIYLDEVTDRQALFVGDVLATGYWATRISEITEDDTVLIIGAATRLDLYITLCYAKASETHYYV